MHDTGLVQESEVGDVVHSVEFGRIHLGEGVEWQSPYLFDSISEGRQSQRSMQTNLSSCSHDDLADVVLLFRDPASEVTVFVVGNPYPLLLVELCLEGCGTGGLCALRGSGRRHSRRRARRRERGTGWLKDE